MLNRIYNEDCVETLKRIQESNIIIDIVMTSPPYGTSRGYYNDTGLDTNQRKYDLYTDRMERQEYADWLVNILNMCESCLAVNGVMLINLSYNNDVKSKGSDLDRMIFILNEIINKTPLTIADRITWKKDRAIPNNTSPNKLTRITEDVFVFSRKTERYTYRMNKQVKNIGENGQKYYNSVWNYIEAPNNDGTCKLNRATYSADLCRQLFRMYAKEGMIVYDPFIGTGTTAVACEDLDLKYIGSEISGAQCRYAESRLKNVHENSGYNRTLFDLAMLNKL